MIGPRIPVRPIRLALAPASSPQPYRYPTYRTVTLGRTWNARKFRNVTPASPRSPGWLRSREREPSGFADRTENGFRVALGSDSGRTRSPYAALPNDITAAAQNGRRRLIPPRSPPRAGPMMKPTPHAAPTMANAPARRSGGVTSATYAEAEG